MVASSAMHAEIRHPVGRGELMQQHGSHRGNLGQGIGLAEEAGAELPPPHRRIENGRHHQDPHIPAEDQHRHRDRNQTPGA